MSFLKKAKQTVLSLASPRVSLAALVALFLGLLPTGAYAGEADVVLNFSKTDQIYLYISLGLGAIALVVAFMLRSGVMRMSPGSEKMREVGLAIKEGALAYLRQQVTTMSIFVLLLGVGLFFLYGKNWMMAVSFLAGVAASYIAGYTGMLMAVEGNMRTANAALTSYKSSLEVAFRSGAVAGMVTVGMGLIGATVIFLVAGNEAMRLLVGFGFGGSLAALFMRVGGGIFTKAADVGADLVGKVEAGIPEDDPRNPATIADNVGDNVGDCAGMAADVFESYEVTLVAAIILGAATAVIFDSQTWMRLILFALMARGVGILASIIGIYSVKGSDNIDTDPLKAIRKGFWASAAIASLGTLALAYLMMGGSPQMSPPIKTSILTSHEDLIRKQLDELHEARRRLATQGNKKPYQVTSADLQKTPEAQKYGLADAGQAEMISRLMSVESDDIPARSASGYRQLDLNGDSPVLGYSIPDQTPGAAGAKFMTIRDAAKKMVFLNVKQTQTLPQSGAQGAAPPQKQESTFWMLSMDPAAFEQQVKESQKAGSFQKLEILGREKPVLYASNENQLAIGLPGKVTAPHTLQAQLRYFKESPKEIESVINEISSDPSRTPPPQEQAQVGVITSTVVPWYMFAVAILFGILMAFAIEILTDYYVSTHKKPVQEVAGVSTTGPAPMIIQGFALAAESSVFSVFSIVIALIAPLVFFPPATYGGTYLLSFYGIALVGLGLLTTTGYILAMDTFGPISDNAQGVFEMSGEGHGNEMGSKAVQRLDAAGNTTKALTKGFAIATAVVAAVALFHSYVEDAQLTLSGMRLEIPEIFLGLLIGGAAPYLFAAFSINAVGRAAFELINEVRRQFRTDPGIMAGTSKPNYASCVAIVTAAAQKELLGPAILAIFLPTAVAFGFSIGKPPVSIGGEDYNLTGAQALGGFLAGAILSGQLMAVLLSNAGGMWDNAKKLIEDGLYGGKGSEAHKAAVVCDTVGDPFKDTAGPAMNPLIKVMNLVALLIAPIVIMPLTNSVLIIITLSSLAFLAFSIWWSKRGSMSSALVAATENAAQVELAHAGEELPQRTTKRITVEDPVDEETH